MTPETCLARVRALSEHRMKRDLFPRLTVPCYPATWDGRRWVTADDLMHEAKATKARRSEFFFYDRREKRRTKHVRINTRGL